MSSRSTRGGLAAAAFMVAGVAALLFFTASPVQKMLAAPSAAGWAQAIGALSALGVSLYIPRAAKAAEERRVRGALATLSGEIGARFNKLLLYHTRPAGGPPDLRQLAGPDLGILVGALERLPLELLREERLITAYLCLLGAARRGSRAYLEAIDEMRSQEDRIRAKHTLRQAADFARAQHDVVIASQR